MLSNPGAVQQVYHQQQPQPVHTSSGSHKHHSEEVHLSPIKKMHSGETQHQLAMIEKEKEEIRKEKEN